jgi:hypothetical protein
MDKGKSLPAPEGAGHMSHLDSASESTPLRNEIVSSEQARIDLLKYKLLTIAVLGAVGLGVGPGAVESGKYSVELQPVYVLCIIPFACNFIDLICWHNTIRILIIARFLISIGDPYERFINALGDKADGLQTGKKARKGPKFFFELEDLALQWSSILLSALLAIFGLFRIGRYRLFHLDVHKDWAFLVVGVIGVGLSVTIHKMYSYRVDILFQSDSGGVAVNPRS